MTYITKLNSFDEVAAWYEKTPVLKSKHHPVEQDIRPIGSRSRKWERIIKISKNCYALSCGGPADPVFNWGWSDYTTKYPVTPKETERLSPIVWRKHKDGTETVTVRNASGERQHNSWYSFLSRALPREMWFRINRQGRQAIYNRSEGKEYYLPKCKTVPRHLYMRYKDQAAKGGKWAKDALKFAMSDFDNLSITFKRNENGHFELFGEAPKEMVHRTRIDKSAKASLKPQIEEIYSWATTMYPLMRDQLNYAFRNDTEKRLREIAEEHKIKGYGHSWSALFARSEPSLIRSIISDPQHPMRYEFGVSAMFGIGDEIAYRRHDDLSDKELQSKVRAAFNRWINKLAGFTSIVIEEK